MGEKKQKYIKMFGSFTEIIVRRTLSLNWKLECCFVPVASTAMKSTTECSCSGNDGEQETEERRRVTAEQRLITALFADYDVDSRGVINASSTVTVDIQFLLLRLQRLVSYDCQSADK